ncbi:hypothetical protein QQG91_03480 [Marivivens sp. LCG002]|nr:hypothetical protein [Marivivens sp. LCG002]WIV51524.1 hypothetical protein QQG91_03480 [Marivivens sp. LCG002]
MSEILVLCAAIFAGCAGIVLFAGARRVRVPQRQGGSTDPHTRRPS